MIKKVVAHFEDNNTEASFSIQELLRALELKVTDEQLQIAIQKILSKR